MKRLLILSLLFSLGKIAGAQTPKEDSIRSEIIKLSYEWNQALVTKDSITLERILSKDFTLSSASGSTIARKEWMENSLRNLITDTAEFVGTQRITVYGTEAISEGVHHWKVLNLQNKIRNNEYFVADIWRYNKGKWEVIHRMSKLAIKL